jgi:hypothetical protein
VQSGQCKKNRLDLVLKGTLVSRSTVFAPCIDPIYKSQQQKIPPDLKSFFMITFDDDKTLSKAR